MLSQLVLLVACVCLLGLLLLVLVEPGLPYRVSLRDEPLDSGSFIRLAGVVADADVHEAENTTVLTNGEAFYAAELTAIQAARTSVHIAAFIFHHSGIADRFLAALIECAKKGVRVRVVVDAIGSFLTRNSYFDGLRAAGGEIAWYQPIRWYTLKRFNNRNHRELIVVDGEVGFIGGAGISSHWSEPQAGNPPWRDSMVRVTGAVVARLQTAFLENWLEATGEILAGKDSFPVEQRSDGGVPALVIISAPSPARASRARVLFQLLIASARETIEINSPYFLPDKSARRELIAAVRRGVRVRIIVPGEHNNHPLARRASRRRYGELLLAGLAIYEYQPGMIHAKIIVVDGLWSVVGPTNFDSRSFEINDEVNLAVVDRTVAARLQCDFERDLRGSKSVSYEDWSKRPWTERILAALGTALERQE